MWTTTKNKVADFCDQIMERLHLNTRSILKWYSIILFVAPLLYWALLEFRIVMEKASLSDMMHNQPAIAISVIVAITDFLLGYYCWINKNKLISSIKELKTFYIWQFVCQLFVGNIICSLLCLFGLRALQGQKNNNVTVSYFKATILVSTILYIFCILLLGLIGLKGLRG
ncbi:hypothetical protein ACRPK1_09725 [Lactobacillus johnsonii]|uniref:hypothetical protein n=1 Tax=Lactobacillus johnsonii TaxID=33959 RepID=UPI003D76D125